MLDDISGDRRAYFNKDYNQAVTNVKKNVSQKKLVLVIMSDHSCTKSHTD